MKIAFVILNANRREGTSRAVLEVAERLAADHTVDLWARTAEDYDASKLRVRRISGPGRPSVFEFRSFVAKADAALTRENYDIIHSAGVNTTLADVYTIQTIQPVKCKMMRDANAHRGASPLRRWTRALYDKAVMETERRCYIASGDRGLRAFAPVSQGARRELLETYSIGEAVVEIIPNGADLNHFSPSKRAACRPVLLNQLGWGEKDFILLFTGGEWRRKGLDVALHAVARISDPRVKLVIAGSDPVSGEFAVRARELGVANRVAFLGFQKHVEQWYGAADLLLFPSRYEAFSLATIEAAASGLPVLMPAISGAEELLGTGEAGVVIERDPEHIARVVLRLASDPAEMTRLRRGARTVAESRFGWDSIAEQTYALYEKLLARRLHGAAPVVGPMYCEH